MLRQDGSKCESDKNRAEWTDSGILNPWVLNWGLMPGDKDKVNFVFAGRAGMYRDLFFSLKMIFLN